MDPFEDPDLPALIAAALEIRDQGIEPPFEELCGKRPDLVETVKLSVETSLRLPTLQRLSTMVDGHRGRVLAQRYHLEERLGAGAMGVVYRAQDMELGRAVAVKILRSMLQEEGEAECRFVREAEVLAAIDHGSVVTVFDRGKTLDEDPFLVMELLEGESLGRLLEEGAREGVRARDQGTGWIARSLGVDALEEKSYLRTAVGWTADLAGGLAAAHREGVFHRDVKPSNVFIRRDGRPVLLDFGIATRVDQATLSSNLTPLGTPAYMAPEALKVGFQPSAAVDVYGLSATLYHMLALRPPFRGTPSQTLTQLVTRGAPPLGRVCPDLPRDLVAIVERGMARLPEDRYRMAEDLEADLRAFLDYRPVQARPLSVWTRSWRRIHRSPLARTLITLLFVGLMALGGLEWRRHWLEGRRAAFGEVWRHMPPGLSLSSPPNRDYPVREDRLAVRRLLDEAVGLDGDHVPAGYLRATFLFDNREWEAASLQMEDLAQDVDTEFARGLAQRYSTLIDRIQTSQDPGDSTALDLSGLPEPNTPEDLYLAACEAMRARRIGDLRRTLADPLLEHFLPAQELAALLMRDDPQGMYDRAVWIEGQAGQRSAMTAHLIGSSLLLQKRYKSALAVIKEGLELAPRSHSLLNNAGLAAWRLGQYDEACAYFRSSMHFKPNFERPQINLVKVLMETGDFDQAERTLDSAVLERTPRADRQRLALRGEINAERALSNLELGRTAAAAEYASSAIEFFAQVSELGGSPPAPRLAIAEGIVNEKSGEIFRGLLELLVDEPAHANSIRVLLGWMPDELKAGDVRSLRGYLTSLAETLDQQTLDLRGGESNSPR